jgi:hypothetical protein
MRWMCPPMANRRAHWPPNFDYDLIVLDLNLPRLMESRFSRMCATGKHSCPS